jgi:hypothetical protein
MLQERGTMNDEIPSRNKSRFEMLDSMNIGYRIKSSKIQHASDLVSLRLSARSDDNRAEDGLIFF